MIKDAPPMAARHLPPATELSVGTGCMRRVDNGKYRQGRDTQKAGLWPAFDQNEPTESRLSVMQSRVCC